MLTEVIGKPAMLEQAAEECTELAHACLKMARFMRKENRVYKSESEIRANLIEEIADVLVCITELTGNNIVDNGDVTAQVERKLHRMCVRLSEV